MKAVIWIICLLVYSAITTAFTMSGVGFGFILTVVFFCITFWVAKTLCKKWDDHKEISEHRSEIDSEEIDETAEQIRLDRERQERLEAMRRKREAEQNEEQS